MSTQEWCEYHDTWTKWPQRLLEFEVDSTYWIYTRQCIQQPNKLSTKNCWHLDLLRHLHCSCLIPCSQSWIYILLLIVYELYHLGVCFIMESAHPCKLWDIPIFISLLRVILRLQISFWLRPHSIDPLFSLPVPDQNTAFAVTPYLYIQLKSLSQNDFFFRFFFIFPHLFLETFNRCSAHFEIWFVISQMPVKISMRLQVCLIWIWKQGIFWMWPKLKMIFMF